MKQVLIRGGEAIVEEVPIPAMMEGALRVRVSRSCISAGTEGASLQSGSKSLLQRAIEDPARVKRAVDMVLDRGIRSTMSAVRGSIGFGSPTGYSVAGTVDQIGAGVRDLAVGDLVACAGAGLANHAEYVVVPRNLTVRIPDGVSFDDASTVTLGAIAMQGVRRLEPTLGERFVVIGLGVLGQITVQVLRANGCRVIGTDLDAKRIDLARSLGMEDAIEPGDEGALQRVLQLTDGYGADGVIITAASPSNEIISLAFQMSRPKGRVVVVGDVGLDIKRADIYRKELEFRISTSYGPGRYDQRYEEGGLDYPIGYVRWTENRNMLEYLRLIADGKVSVGPLVSQVYAVEEAPAAFAAAVDGSRTAPLVLLSYPGKTDTAPSLDGQRISLRSRAKAGKIGIAVVGAGAFTRGVHIPNLRRLSDSFDLRAVVNRTGTSAKRVADEVGATYAATDFGAVLSDPEIDAVLIGTRHDQHARMTVQALSAGKHVLVEKPLAIRPDELAEIEAYYAAVQKDGSSPPVLLTGYNRRFSEYAKQLKGSLQKRTNPAVLSYRMNAGYLPLDHWLQTDQGGGRNIGEACHIYDLFLFLLDASVVDVKASAINPVSGYYARSDNFSATLSFDDGSIATLIYTALGHSGLAKERLEVFVDGRAAVLDDYRELSWYGTDDPPLRTKDAEKGHLQELEAFANVIRDGGDWPISLKQQLDSARISFAVESVWDSGLAAFSRIEVGAAPMQAPVSR